MMDHADTLDAVIAASELPISIVVAGLKSPVSRVEGLGRIGRVLQETGDLEYSCMLIHTCLQSAKVIILVKPSRMEFVVLVLLRIV